MTMSNQHFEQNTPFECLRLYTWKSRLFNGRPFEISSVHWNEVDARTSLLQRLAKVKTALAEMSGSFQQTASNFTNTHLAGFECEKGDYNILDITGETKLHNGTTVRHLIVCTAPEVRSMNYTNIVVS